jgi:hypothetical protein
MLTVGQVLTEARAHTYLPTRAMFAVLLPPGGSLLGASVQRAQGLAKHTLSPALPTVLVSR